MKKCIVLSAVRGIFITWDDRGTDVNSVGGIFIPSKERYFPSFGSLPPNGSHLSSCFELAVSARKAAKDADLSYKTTLKSSISLDVFLLKILPGQMRS